MSEKQEDVESGAQEEKRNLLTSRPDALSDAPSQPAAQNSPAPDGNSWVWGVAFGMIVFFLVVVGRAAFGSSTPSTSPVRILMQSMRNLEG